MYKQLLKEKRSGLFHNEQVFCLCSVKSRVVQWSEHVLFTFRAVCSCVILISPLLYNFNKKGSPLRWLQNSLENSLELTELSSTNKVSLV